MKFFILGIAGITVTAAVFFSRHNSSLNLFDTSETYFEYGIFSNSQDNETLNSANHGHTHFLQSSPLINQQPHQFLLFHANDLFRTINIKKYNLVEVVVLPQHDRDVIITLYMYVPGLSDLNMESNRPYSFIIRMRPHQERYRIKLRDFATPGWWFGKMKVREEDLPKTDRNRITHISISDFPFNLKENPDEWVAPVTEINFVNDGSEIIINLFILGILVALISVIILRSAKKTAKILREPAQNPENVQASKLIKFINENYTSPDLTLKNIEKELGLTKFQVNNIMQSHCLMNYRQYVNGLQIGLAKELLGDKKNIPIQEIAQKVGYLHVNSFSRAFKAAEGITPAEFRKSLVLYS